ncbi:hypothetical protein FOMPIDRAFT_1027275 [Fomitopsis schrenkii]|uniref:Cytochrome P450 n=1 Tax=Fomitopsis schrenkii TaxID=2126942 RepID=S8FXA8_FOMSC|nr:hypothetical protein FOMPIDRAFT_1027275 [Fomitopsis schrenkii]
MSDSDSQVYFALQCLGATLCISVLYSFYAAVTRRKDLPPGPKRAPFFGNGLQLPKLNQHLKMTEWARQYGDVVYAEFFGQPTVIINSVSAAATLMDNGGAKYSDKPRLVYLNELVQWTGNLGFAPYNDRWKRLRGWFQRGFIARSAQDSYRPIQRREVRRLLSDLAQHPQDFRFSLKRYMAAIMLEIGYGHTVSSLGDDEFIKLVEDGVRKCLSGSGPGATLVDFFPILRYVPAWIPGMEFKRSAATARKAIRDMEAVPYRKVMKEMADGTAKPSYVTQLIDSCLKDGVLEAQDQRDIEGTVGVLYADTSMATLLVFILMMTQNPDIFEKTQDEISRVVGQSRLPDFKDRGSLPYLECVLREAYRWCPAIPIIPHQSMEDDVYRGYYIPNKAVIVMNAWAMSRDPEVYPEPDVFKPERFLTQNGGVSDLHDPRKFVFGFGRRICPGRYFADTTIWLAAASIVATMDFRQARNSQGDLVVPNPQFVSGSVMHPEPFICDIRPRSEKSLQLISDSESGY